MSSGTSAVLRCRGPRVLLPAFNDFLFHGAKYAFPAVRGSMVAGVPRAMFLAFTGTPLIAGEERTREVFGDYVSIYDFQQSIEDGATVPLFYENRTAETARVQEDWASCITSPSQADKA